MSSKEELKEVIELINQAAGKLHGLDKKQLTNNSSVFRLAIQIQSTQLNNIATFLNDVQSFDFK